MHIFNSFQARLTVFIISLLIFSLTATFIAVNNVSIKNTIQEINNSLQVSSDIFESQLRQNQDKLFEIARLLSSDYAFKSAYSTSDHDTILSAMENHLSRVSGDNMMMLVSLDGKVIAHTILPALKNTNNPWLQLQNAAENNDYGEATLMVVVGKTPFQMMVVPLLTPDLDAWIYIGFPIDQLFVDKINKITRTEVTIAHRETKKKVNIPGSTLSDNDKKSLQQYLQLNSFSTGENITVSLSGSEYISHAIRLKSIDNLELTAVLQRSLNEALVAYKDLQTILFIIFTISLLISVALAFIIARQVTQPVNLLSQGAERIEHGDYEHDIKVKRRDEIGQLAHSFNSMAKGLAEKEKVRNLLGKVVSTAIAEELLSKDIALGGEERFVTVLFSDVRNFTSLCEGRDPKEILSLLNEYFTKISTKIEENNGVVDKYIGDAVMAIFGAPVQHKNDAVHSIVAAFEMCSELKKLNENFKQRGIAPLGIGIGINSGLVVAGNMGSKNRLNYTVIGDDVNLASRLEGLTKHYGVEIIVSEETAKIAPEFIYRELDLVKVKGKKNVCKILEPLGHADKVSPDTLNSLEIYHQALYFYQARQWAKAKDEFEKLLDAQPSSVLYQLYVNRCEEMLKNPADENWDGSYIFTSK